MPSLTSKKIADLATIESLTDSDKLLIGTDADTYNVAFGTVKDEAQETMVPKNWGSENVGKFLAVGSNGEVALLDAGGSTILLQQKTATQNGTVTADSGYDGLSSVEVNVQGGGGGSVLITKTITQNGTYNASADNADGYSQVVVNVSGGGGSVTPLQFHLGRLKIDTGVITDSSEYCYSDLIPISQGPGRWFLDLSRSDVASYYIGISFFAQDGETNVGYIRQYENYRSYQNTSGGNAKYFRIANTVSNLSFASAAFLADGIYIFPQSGNVYRINLA